MTLWPPLAHIEEKWFTPSDELFNHWINDPDSLPSDLHAELDAHPKAQQLNALHSQMDEADIAAAIGTPLVLPEHLRELIKRRTAAQTAKISTDHQPGQIRFISHLTGPSGYVVNQDLPQVVAVVLNEPTASDQVWYAWMTAEEIRYASYWDVILEEEDQPIDPMVGMVQVWNPVMVYLPSTERIVGQLSETRLQAIRAVAYDYLLGSDLDPSEAAPGILGYRILAEHNNRRVYTGTPLSGSDDPRWQYQLIYHQVADAVREPAQIALAELTEASDESNCPQPVEILHGQLKQLGDWLKTLHEPMLESTFATGSSLGIAGVSLGSVAIAGAIVGIINMLVRKFCCRRKDASTEKVEQPQSEIVPPPPIAGLDEPYFPWLPVALSQEGSQIHLTLQARDPNKTTAPQVQVFLDGQPLSIVNHALSINEIVAMKDVKLPSLQLILEGGQLPSGDYRLTLSPSEQEYISININSHRRAK